MQESNKEPRMPYQEIKDAVLSAYFDFSRDLVHKRKHDRSFIFGHIEYEFESVFQYPVETLM